MRGRRARRKDTRTPPFLRAGKQTQIDRRILEFASRFPGKRLKDINAIVMAIAGFKRKKFDAQTMEKMYSKRTASQIIQDKFVAVDLPIDVQNRASVHGCIDYHVVLCSVLRAKGIPAQFVRKKDHSTVHFFLIGKWYEADVNAALIIRKAQVMEIRSGFSAAGIELKKPIRALSPEELKASKKSVVSAHGLDAWDIGIKNIHDYNRYNK